MSSELLGSLERGIEREQIERKSARVVAVESISDR